MLSLGDGLAPSWQPFGFAQGQGRLSASTIAARLYSMSLRYESAGPPGSLRLSTYNCTSRAPLSPAMRSANDRFPSEVMNTTRIPSAFLVDCRSARSRAEGSAALLGPGVRLPA